MQNLHIVLFIFFAVIFNACGEDQPCVTPSVSSEISDSRIGRSEGKIEYSATFDDLYTYIWDNGFTGPKLTELAPGQYCVTIANISNASCSIDLCNTIQGVNDFGNSDLNDGRTKVLMIGNSHTFFHNMPSTFKSILDAELDEAIEIQESTKAGYTFNDHVDDENTLINIRSNNWDYVILQENATRASLPSAAAKTGMYPFAEELFEQIIDNNPETKVILYMTHAYADGLEDCDVNPHACSNELMQNRIRSNYLDLNSLIESNVAPAGIMWKILVKANQELELWSEDKIHPSALGSAVSAATIAAIVVGKKLSDDSLSSTEVDANFRKEIIDVINKSIYDSEPDWTTF